MMVGVLVGVLLMVGVLVIKPALEIASVPALMVVTPV